MAWTPNTSNLFVNQDPSADPSISGDTFPRGDFINQNPIIIPPILPYSSYTSYYEWPKAEVPNPLWYYTIRGGQFIYSSEVNICMLARIETCDNKPFGMTFPETKRTYLNIRNNNNIVARNSRLINLDGLVRKSGGPLVIEEPEEDGDTTTTDTGTITVTVTETTPTVYSTYGTVTVFMDDVLWNAWAAGGYLGTGYTIIQSNELEITNTSTFSLEGIDLHPDSIGNMTFEFELDSLPTTNVTTQFAVAQFKDGEEDPQGVFVYAVEIEAGPPIGGMQVKNDDDEQGGENNNGAKDALSQTKKSGTLDKPEENNEGEEVVQELSKAPNVFAYPNPFSNAVNFQFSLPEEGQVGFDIYNSIGMKIGAIAEKDYDKGTHKVTFDGKHLSPGAYFCKVNINGEIKTICIILNR